MEQWAPHQFKAPLSESKEFQGVLIFRSWVPHQRKAPMCPRLELSCDFQFKGARFNSEVDRRSEVEITDAPSIKRGPSSYKNSGLPYRRESI